MESFTLTRKEMSHILLSLTRNVDQEPPNNLQVAWTKFHKSENQNELPVIVQKIMQGRIPKGLSLGDIAALGSHIEYSTLTVTAMQNWVKRDFKDYLGSPRQGKKYSMNQAALLFMIDDLKAALDFESIRQLFHQLSLRPERDDDDLIEPAQLYKAYAGLFETIKCNPSFQNHQMNARYLTCGKSWKDCVIEDSTEGMMKRLAHLTRTQSEAVWNTIFIAAISVQTCYFQSLARQSFHSALFLDF